MKTIRFTIAVIIIGITLISCETNKIISVKIIDKVTRQPIDSVFVEVKAGKNGDYTKNYAKGYTNSEGKFETQMMIGCAFGCYDIYMEYDKKGYTHKSELNKTEGTVELEH
jgi:5-hydroxyisourate hydrolase-like protein (transthyretin family)